MRTRLFTATATRPARRLQLESFEARNTPSTTSLSGGVLTITGTAAAEDVSVYIATVGPSTGRLVVEDCYGSGPILCGITDFDPASVVQIKFYGYGGDDYFTNSTDKYTLAFGGIGNDTLISGSAGDDLLGDDGNDYIDGNGGKDNIGGGEGNDTIYGATEEDWLK